MKLIIVGLKHRPYQKAIEKSIITITRVYRFENGHHKNNKILGGRNVYRRKWRLGIIYYHSCGLDHSFFYYKVRSDKEWIKR